VLGIVLRALRRRRVHAATLFLLGVIAAATAAAAPGYAVASAENLAASALTEASAAERLVSVTGDVSSTGPLDERLSQLDDLVTPVLDLPGFERVNDVRLSGHIGDTRADIVYRQGVCDRLSVVGACATRSGEVVLANDMAGLLKAQVGTRMTFVGTDLSRPVTLTVVGIYRPTNPADPYWGVSQTSEDGTVTGERFVSGTLFTPVSTFVDNPPRRVEATVDFIASPAAVRARDPQTLALSFEQATPGLGAKNLTVVSKFRTFADRNLDETNLIYIGVIAATVQLLILVWFALALAIRQTGQSRRPDAALLKLRGVGGRSLWSLAAGQAAVPIVSGGVVGLVLGAIGARWWAGPVSEPGRTGLVLIGTPVAAVAAVVIAVVAALAAERRMLAEPVIDLARQVPARARGWRTGVLDAALLALALAAAVELRSSAVATKQFRGLDVLAPTLVALAVGIVAAWLVPRAAQAVASPALRAGRVGLGLAAVHLARRTSLPRVLTLVTLAVAVVTGAAISSGVALSAQRERAEVEVGADRVLTVQTTSGTTLLDAVRAADPSGRSAMAVVRSLGGTPTLALDSTRLAAVVPWQAAYGLPDWATVARALQTGSAAPMSVHSGVLSVSAGWKPHPGSSATLAAVVAQPDGTVLPVSLGPLRPGQASYQATISGCDPGCRLVGFQLTGPPDLVGSELTLHQVSGAAVVPAAAFTDRGRWRTSVVLGDELPTVSTSDSGLVVSINHLVNDNASITFPVYVRDAQSPLPMYTTGDIERKSLVDGPTVQAPGAGPVPAQVVGFAALLPRLGGTGRLVDLQAIDELRPASGRFEVWLAPGTPAAVVTALRAQGLSIVDDETVAARVAQLQDQGPPVAMRYLLAVALVGFALAIGAFALAARVERPARAEELAALRWQGLAPHAVRLIAYGGYLTFAVVAVGLGVGTALLADRYIIGPPRVFGDGWSGLPVPPPAWALLGAIVAAVTVLVVAVALGAAGALVRGVRRGGS
jgi:hypothetical protein